MENNSMSILIFFFKTISIFPTFENSTNYPQIMLKNSKTIERHYFKLMFFFFVISWT